MKRGQLTIYGLLIWFITGIVLAGLTPVLNDIITNSTQQVGGWTSAIGQLVVPLMWVIWLVSLLIFAYPIRPE